MYCITPEYPDFLSLCSQNQNRSSVSGLFCISADNNPMILFVITYFLTEMVWPEYILHNNFHLSPAQQLLLYSQQRARTLSVLTVLLLYSICSSPKYSSDDYFILYVHLPICSIFTLMMIYKIFILKMTHLQIKLFWFKWVKIKCLSNIILLDII